MRIKNLEPFDLDSATRRKPGGGWICGGGGSSSSASTSSNQTTNVDKRQVVDNGALGVTADNSSITVNHTQTDQGAIKAAGDLANSALTTNATNFATLMDTVKVLTQSASDALKANTTLASNLTTTTQSAYADAASQAQGNKNLVYAGMAVIGLAAVSFLRKKG